MVRIRGASVGKHVLHNDCVWRRCVPHGYPNHPLLPKPAKQQTHGTGSQLAQASSIPVFPPTCDDAFLFVDARVHLSPVFWDQSCSCPCCSGNWGRQCDANVFDATRCKKISSPGTLAPKQTSRRGSGSGPHLVTGCLGPRADSEGKHGIRGGETRHDNLVRSLTEGVHVHCFTFIGSFAM